MSSKKIFTSGLRWVAAGRLSAQLVSWVGTLYVMRTLLPQDYGLAALCSSTISIIAIIAEFGIGASIVQAKSFEEEEVRSVYGASILFYSVCALALIVSSPALAWFFRAPEVTALIRVSALQFVFAPFAVIPEAMLRRDLRFSRISVVEFTAAICASLVTIVMAYRGAGVWSIVVGPVASSAIRLMMLYLLAPLPTWPSFRLSPAKNLLNFGYKVAVSRIIGSVFGQIDILIAGRFLSKSALGEYSVAMTLAMLPVNKAMGIINQVAYPMIAQMRRDSVAMQPALLGSLRLFAYVLIPLLWGMAAVSDWLVPILVGSSWKNAVLPLQLVCVALPVRMISVMLSSVLHGLGHAGLEMRCTITGVALLSICFLAGASFGAVGLASAWLIGLPIMVALNIWRSKDVLGFGLLQVLRALSKPIALSACMCVIVLTVGHVMASDLSASITLLITVTTGAIVYLGLLWTLDRANARTLLAFLKIGSE